MLAGFSRHVVPVPRDYPEYAHVTGWNWFLDQARGWEPPADLAGFLAAGEPPVYIGLGSMGFGRQAAARGRIVLDAVDRVGVRAIIARGWGGLEPTSSSSQVYVTDAVPHDWLFPRTAGVVHHGGAGRLPPDYGRPANTGLSGIRRSRLLGRTSTRTRLRISAVPMRRLSVDGLADHPHSLINNPTYRNRAQEIGDALAAEDGRRQCRALPCQPGEQTG